MSARRDQGAPDSVEPILGWRVWHLNRDGLLRAIAVTGQAWSPGTNEARCHMHSTRHRAPAKNCVCGFNALHLLPEEFRGDAGHAIGAIAAWGEVDVYRTGFRSQFACVLGLLADAPEGSFHDEKLRLAAGHYGVPLLSLPELDHHARRHAKPAGQLLQPGINRRPGHVDRPTQPLPIPALPTSFEGRGVQVNAHIAVDHRRRFMRLGPTPSLASLASERVEPAVAAGDIVADGDPLFVSSVGPSIAIAPAPAPGTVIAVNDAVRIFEEGPAGAGWLVELRLEAESLDGSSIAWGRRGAETYREYVLAAGSDADLLLTCAENPGPADSLLDSDEGRAWLRAFAQRLDTAIRGDEALAAALRSVGSSVGFEVDRVEVLRIAPPPLGSGRWASTTADPGEDALRIELRPDSLRRYWRGELGLAPDDVSVAGAGAKRQRNPLHLLSGDRGGLLLANSLHKRLFPAAREILDGLGNPWFKAGDAISDPVRSLEVLADFKRPDTSAAGAA